MDKEGVNGYWEAIKSIHHSLTLQIPYSVLEDIGWSWLYVAPIEGVHGVFSLPQYSPPCPVILHPLVYAPLPRYLLHSLGSHRHLSLGPQVCIL